MKIQVSMDAELVHRADVYADSNYLTRSGLISIAVVNYLNQQEALQSLRSLASTLTKISESGKLSDDDRQSIKDFERLAGLLLVR